MGVVPSNGMCVMMRVGLQAQVVLKGWNMVEEDDILDDEIDPPDSTKTGDEDQPEYPEGWLDTVGAFELAGRLF